MNEAFDPYHVWLGIPPEEQPPNHYRLLGIALFEGNADVIAMAADRQMGHLRTFQSGKHSELSQRLLNKVAGAKVCLLNSAKKAAYDEQLRQQLSPPEGATLAPVDSTLWAQPIPVPDTEESSQWADITDSAPSTARTRHAARKRQTSLGPMIAVAVAGVLLLGGFLTWNATRRTDNTQAIAQAGQKSKSEPTGRQSLDQPEPRLPGAIGDSPKPTTPETPVPPNEPEEPAAEVEPAAPSLPIAPGPPEEPPAAKADFASSLTRPTFEKPTEAAEKPTDSPERPAVPSFDFSADKPNVDKPSEQPPAAKKRLSVPDDAKQQEIVTQIGSIYNPSRAKTPAERVKLAYRLLQAAKASKEPNERYVLLHQGRELAGQAGDVALVLQVIEITAAEFDINLLEEQKESLLTFGEKANAEQIRSLFNASQRVIAQALSAGRCELAADLANGVYRTCQRSQGKEFRKKALDQRDWVQHYCRRQAERQEAEAKLKDNPEDADAHLVLGRHCCLDDDWKKGLSHLAKGSDPELRQLAEQDVASSNEPAGQIKLADAWWTLGKTRNGEERDLLLLRAGYWYDRAHAKLTSGLNRLKAEKRLEEIVELRQRHAVNNRLLHPGNDAPGDLWNGLF